MGHRHSRDDILTGALAVASAHGLSRLSYGRVATHLGISDRVVVYYFPSKDALVTDVLSALGARLQAALAEAFGSPARDHRELLRLAWPLLATPDADPVFALFFEASGLAAAGREPYRTVLAGLVEAWVTWVAQFVQGSDERRRSEAEAAIAVIDGLLLLRRLAGPHTADRAAAALGIR